MFLIQNKHLVGYFDIFYSIAYYQLIDLSHDVIWAPSTDAVAAERCIYATELTAVGTSQAGLNRGVTSAAIQIMKAVPIMSPVSDHIQ